MWGGGKGGSEAGRGEGMERGRKKGGKKTGIWIIQHAHVCIVQLIIRRKAHKLLLAILTTTTRSFLYVDNLTGSTYKHVHENTSA